VIKHRSKFEDKVIKDLKSNKVDYKYESLRITYTLDCFYTPDVLLPNGIIVEIKGFFRAEDRRKHLQIKKQRPDLDIRFVFQDGSKKISRMSKTTYTSWADKHNFKWAIGYVPVEWVMEPPSKTSALGR